MSFGPWAPDVEADERRRQFRSLAALAAAFTGSDSALVFALREAERDQGAAARALEILNGLPALTRRRLLLSVFGEVTWPRTRRSRGAR
jgi:hypothetical protein